MKQIWGLNGVRAWATGINTQADVAVEGIGTKAGTIYTWQAVPNAHGWLVATQVELTGWAEEFQGATFNLGLEVATAIGRSK